MTDDDLVDPETFYDEYGEREWERLDRTLPTRLEFENTIEYLERALPDAGRLLDAGGGAGRYVIWLAERGYDVTLVDRSAGQLDVARGKIAERGLSDAVANRRADVRDHPLEDGVFDAVCCLGGPLSHVLDADGRARAAGELARIARDDAPGLVSVMGRLAVLQELLLHTAVEETHELLLPLARTGDYDRDLVDGVLDDPEWTECHFYRADEFERELTDAGLSVETLVGLEAVASNFHDALDDTSDDARESVRELAHRLREDRAVADLSEHLLAVCRV
jgi:SAM-dependent methyltransferase